ncbi:hypothetical protein [Xylocopilactobacillus apicola]|uniref:Lipoprotein n=1 Tax=Xylocopilactobacillus apicola TaxID=2932184 RepID=A0AAU9D9F6_9LACO|nr:hypothetical protein [Xylocopilactobacillus apicola]BDR58985.1 lipoprotein [Xylocopilactobacillus apicola]
MKNKKRFIALMLLSVLLVLTGCGTSDKQTLVNHFNDLANQKNSQLNFDVKVTKLDLGTKISATDRSYVSILKSSSLTGDLSSDGTNAKARMKIHALEEEVPLEFVGNQDKVYLKGDFISSVYKVMSDFDAEEPDVDASIFKGKYIDVIDVLKESGELSSKQQKETAAASKSTVKLQKNLATSFKEAINSLPQDSVTKKDGVITAVLHKKDFVNLLEKFKKDLDQDKDLKENPLNQKDIDSFNSEFKTFDYVIKYNPKANTLNYTITLAPKDGGEIQLQVNTKSKEFNDKIKLPAKSDIIDAKTIMDEYEDF